jgi:hypothetical protein
MDPDACLDAVQDALKARDFADASDALQDYWSWRWTGGFQPHRGDERATWLRQAWCSQLTHLEALSILRRR